METESNWDNLFDSMETESNWYLSFDWIDYKIWYKDYSDNENITFY